MANKEFKPYVPAGTPMAEFGIAALVLGLIMAVVLGAANAYLGLRAGMTIAATYPAAVISMAVLRLFKGTILQENISRTVGSIGESVAAGAIFTIPAFVILGLWDFDKLSVATYFKATALMTVGGILGVLFITILRRMMVEDQELGFPESRAAAEIHKAGQRGGAAAKQLFMAMGVGAFIKLLGDLNFFQASKDLIFSVGNVAKNVVRLGTKPDSIEIHGGGTSTFAAPDVAPAYLGVGYIIGPQLGALNFAGSLLAWGLMVPLLVFFMGPRLIGDFAAQQGMDPAASATWVSLAQHIWRFIVRPIAVGGMLVGAGFTLFKMRKNLAAGLKRAVGDVRKSAGATGTMNRYDRDLSFKIVALGIAVVFVLMCLLYFYFTQTWGGAVAAAVVMLITGFFFAAVSGNLVGMIGSSNNPVSGLALSTLVIAAAVVVWIGLTKDKADAGMAAVLGVASIGCISAAVAGEMLQDLKVGHILGGTPWKMQVGDMIGVVFSAAVMVFPVFFLYKANIGLGGIGFGDRNLPAPQAGLMAMLTKGIVGGEMAWPLVLVGVAMGFAMILVKVRSPMLFSVGMYLPVGTTFAIFVGGLIHGIADWVAQRKNLNPAQKARVGNSGMLVAAGLIAGEALMGLALSIWVVIRLRNPEVMAGDVSALWNQRWYTPHWLLAAAVVVALALFLIYRPLGQAGRPDEPPPPEAVM